VTTGGATAGSATTGSDYGRRDRRQRDYWQVITSGVTTSSANTGGATTEGRLGAPGRPGAWPILGWFHLRPGWCLVGVLRRALTRLRRFS
jgi:hypothetical protein